ncbi:MAG: D-glucuronyl C5-epimerase family protein [Solirubrobacteraceae bacterium]
MERTSQRWRQTAGWAWGSAFSRGETFEAIPAGRAFSTETVRGYYLDYGEKTRAAGAAAPERLLSIGVVQLALGWWERSRGAAGPAADRFLAACELALARGEARGEALYWPVTVAVAKFGLRPPWHSALVQAQAASVFVRAELLTGEERWGAAARAAIAPLLEPSGELVTATSRGPILEEAPSVPASHILNGWISALFGVRDVALAHGDARAGSAFAAGVDALRDHLPAYDTGWWTRYCLYPHPLEDLAKPIYHRIHADQIDALHRVTGIAEFGDAAARWRAYDRPAARAAAVAQKALFVAVDGGRRRRRPRFETDVA